MNDYLVKALAFDGTIRAYAVRSTETVAEVQRRHAYVADSNCGSWYER